MAVETSQALQQLHHLLQQLADAESLLSHGPKRVAAAKKKITAAEQVCETQKEKIRELRKASDQKNLSLKSNEAEIVKLTGRLNEASSNKEYDIIQGQVADQRAANEALEDAILSLLTEVDDATTELETAEEAVKQLVQRCKDIEAEVKEREPGIRDDIARLTSEIEEAESAFPPGDSRVSYERLRSSMGAGALSEVQDTFCLACNTKVIAQDCVRLKIGEIVSCRECGRMLYMME